jgi:four helix bundle protein
VGIASYRDLLVWKHSMDLAKSFYRLTVNYPKSEVYGLTSQIRRAAASVPANIAEGYGRENTGSSIQFLRLSQGSLKELETHLLLSEGVGTISIEAVNTVLVECESVGKLLAMTNPVPARQASIREVRILPYSLTSPTPDERK